MSEAVLYFQQEYQQDRFRMMRIDLSKRRSLTITTSLDNPDPGVVANDGSAMLLRQYSWFKER